MWWDINGRFYICLWDARLQMSVNFLYLCNIYIYIEKFLKYLSSLISWGRKTEGKQVICWNIVFESRWLRRLLKQPVSRVTVFRFRMFVGFFADVYLYIVILDSIIHCWLIHQDVALLHYWTCFFVYSIHCMSQHGYVYILLLCDLPTAQQVKPPKVGMSAVNWTSVKTISFL